MRTSDYRRPNAGLWLLRVGGLLDPARDLRPLREGRVHQTTGPTENHMPHYFDHENLDCYRLAADTARWVCKTVWPRGMSELKVQAVRSSTSVCLNIAEGCARKGKSGVNHLSIARGSAAETAAAIDIAFGQQGSTHIENLRRVSVMLSKLARRYE